MAITLFGTPQTVVDTNSGVDTTLTVAIPNGGTVVSADTLGILTTMDRAGSPSFATPSGYTLLGSALGGSNLDEIQVFWKIFTNGSTLPANVVATNSASWTFAGAIYTAYQGHNSASPFDGGVTGSSTLTGSPFVVSGVTTAGANEVVVWVFFPTGDVGTGSITISQGTSEVTIPRSATSANFYANYVDETFASAGATGTNTLTWSGSGTVSVGATFAINPAVALTVPQLMASNMISGQTLPPLIRYQTRNY